MGCFACGNNESDECRASNEIDKKINQWQKEERTVVKLLLLGPGESGKTTIIKQMKILHIQGFTTKEREDQRIEIRRNALEAIKELVGNMAFINPPVSLANPDNQESFDFINNTNMMQDYHYPPEFYHHVKKLWQDDGIKHCFTRSNEFQLIDSAEYFLNKIDSLKEERYSPSDQDILCSRKRTSDIQRVEFEVKPPKNFGSSTKPQKFWMFDVGGQRGERRKWIQVFDGITAVWFLVACSGFDSKLREDNTTNRLEEALKLFEEVWFSRFLRMSDFILFLNKQDVLQQKVNQGIKIQKYYSDYEQYEMPSSEGDPKDEYLRVRSFIKEKFLSITTKSKPKRFSTAELYYDMHGESKARQCYTHYTTATDTNNIQTVFNDVHVTVIMQNLNKVGAIS